MTSESIERAVRELAYAKWELAGHPEGNGIQFWLEAERELCEESLPTSRVPVETSQGNIKSSAAAEVTEPLKLAKTPSGSRRKAG